MYTNHPFSQKINPDTEVVELVPDSANPATLAELVQAISPTEPRFTFFRFRHARNGVQAAPLLFFYTCPMTPGNRAIKFGMLYPLMKRAVLHAASSDEGASLAIDHKFEMEDPTDITEDGVMAELYPTASARQGFSRPKRPGR